MAINLINPNHVLIGLGGTGGKILKAFKKRWYAQYPDAKQRNESKPAFSFLYVDSTTEMMTSAETDPSWRVLGNDASFTNNEFCNIRPANTGIGQILDHVSTLPTLKYIVRNAEAMRNTLGEIKTAAGQKRRAGRIMFASNATAYLESLKNKYADLMNRTHENSLHVHIFTGLAGGTGSGSIIDVVALTRKHYPDAAIDVYAMVPEKDVPAKLQAGRYHQNGYAALMELSALNVGRFSPCDVENGDEHIHFHNPEDLKQFGLMLFSNVNENGVVFPSVLSDTTGGESEEELIHSLIADTAYFRLNLPNSTGGVEDICRAWSCENLDGHQVEYDTKARSVVPVRARTKAIATCGIKRIVFPEQRIIQHIAYTTTLRVLWQMQYNNFKEEGIGYIDEPERRDYSEIVSEGEHGNRAKWMLDDKHLMLETRILETDRRFKNFYDYWKEQAEFYEYKEAKNNSDNPITYIEGFCQQKFDSNFRLKKGVLEYYRDKAEEAVLHDQSACIVDAIERDLYAKWYEGTYSMYDLLGYCDAILEFISKESDSIDNKKTGLDESIGKKEKGLKDNKKEYNAVFWGKLVGKPKTLFSDHQMLLCNYYVEKTMLVALDFKSKLLGQLKKDFEEFSAEINAFIEKILKAQEALIRYISDRTRKSDELSLHGVLVEVAEDRKMEAFEKQLIASKTKMSTLAGILRRELVGNQMFAHFGELARKININSVTDIADKLLTPQIKVIHDEECKNDKILGINVLEQLQKKIESSSLTLKNFANQLYHECGTFLVLDDHEMGRTFNNNPAPTPQSMNRLFILVCMPDYSQNDDLKDFGERLEQAMRDSFPPDVYSLNFIHMHNKTNEMTLLLVRNAFPIRALSWLPAFKSEYDALVNSPNEQERRQNIIMLHSEGDGKDLPLLEGEGEAPKGDELIKYLFIAAAMGILKIGEDANEEKGWCIVTYDRWKNEELKCLSPTFIGIQASDDFTSNLQESIVDQVEAHLKDEDLKKNDRNAIAEQIVKMMQTTIKDEAFGTTNTTYKKWSKYAEAAIDMVEKK